MSKASWINKEGYYTIFYLIRSGLDLSEIARVTHRGYKTIKRARRGGALCARCLSEKRRKAEERKEQTKLCL